MPLSPRWADRYSGHVAGRPHGTNTPLGKLLAERGIRVYELALACQIPERTISSYINAHAEFQDHHLTAISDALDVEPAELLTRSASR